MILVKVNTTLLEDNMLVLNDKGLEKR